MGRAGGHVLWHVNLGLAAAMPNALFRQPSTDQSYADITPQVGITSTPVIDLATNTMYIDSFTRRWRRQLFAPHLGA